MEHDHDQCVELLLAAGALVNRAVEKRLNALGFATETRKLKYVHMLIQAGADVNAAFDNCQPALTVAAASGWSAIIDVLVKAGANVNFCPLGNETALMKAARLNNIECVEALIKVGADVNIVVDHYPSKRAGIALMCAVRQRNEEVVQKLLQAGADVNITHWDDETALIEAVSLEDMNIVKMLVEAGANLNAVGAPSGETALQQAVRRERGMCAKYLLEKGVHIANIFSYEMGSSKIRAVLAAAGSLVDFVAVLLIDDSDSSSMSYSSNVEMEVMLSDGTLADLVGLEAGRRFLSSQLAEPNLMTLCRKAIRKHLLKISPVNLYHRVPKLRLPSAMHNFLLFNMKLDLLSQANLKALDSENPFLCILVSALDPGMHFLTL